MKALLARAAAVAGICALATVVFATSDAAAATPEEDKLAAQEQFAEGRRAFAAGDYRLAAKAFEEAYRRKPHHSPLWNAARSWQRAGESVRAANLYVKYLREAPPGTPDRDVATQSLAELRLKLGKIVAHSAGPTELAIDDAAADVDGVFVAPGEHIVSGHVGTTVVRKSVKVVEGQVLSVTLEPPKKDEPPPPPPPPSRPGREGFHLPWVVVAATSILTLAGGGLTIWSGLDTNAKRKQFDSDVAAGGGTQGQIDDGKSRQTRTNIFLGVTAGLFVLTGVAALFVDWGNLGSSSSTGRAITLTPTASSNGAGFMVDGRL